MKIYSIVLQKRTFAVHVPNDSIKDFNQNFLQSELHPLERKDKGLHLIFKKLNAKDNISVLPILNRYLINKDIITTIYSNFDPKKGEKFSYVFYIIHPPHIDFKTCIDKKIPYCGSIEIFYVVSPGYLDTECKSLLKLQTELFKLDTIYEDEKLFKFSKKKAKEPAFITEEVKKFLIKFEEKIKRRYQDDKNRLLVETSDKLLNSNCAELFLSLHIPGYKYDNSKAKNLLKNNGFLNKNYPYLESDDITFENKGSRLETLKNCVFMRSQIITMPFITSRGTFVLQNGREVKMEKSIGYSNGLSFQVQNAGKNPITGDNQSDLVSSIKFGLASEQTWKMNISNIVLNIYKLHKDLFSQDRENQFLDQDYLNYIVVYNSHREIFRSGLENFKLVKKINVLKRNKENNLLKWIVEFQNKIKTSPEISIISDVYRLNSIDKLKWNQNSTSINELEKKLRKILGLKSFKIDDSLDLMFLNYLLNLIFELDKRKSYFYLEGLDYIENIHNTPQIKDVFDILDIFSHNIYDLCNLIFERKDTLTLKKEKSEDKYNVIINICNDNIQKHMKFFNFFKNMSKGEKEQFILDYQNNLFKFVFSPLTYDNLSISDYLNIIFIQLESLMKSHLDFGNINISKYLVRGLQIFGLHSLENVRSDDLISSFLNSSTMHIDKKKLFEASSPYHLRSRYEGCIMVELCEDILEKEMNYSDAASYYPIVKETEINLNYGWNYMLENFDIVPVTKNSIESSIDEQNIFESIPPRGKSIRGQKLKLLLDPNNKKMISGWSLVGRTLVGIEVIRIKEESDSFEILTEKEISDLHLTFKDKLTNVQNSWSHPDSVIENWNYFSNFTMLNQLPLSTRSVLKPSDIYNLRNRYSPFCLIEIQNKANIIMNIHSMNTAKTIEQKEDAISKKLPESDVTKHRIYFYFSRKWNDSFQWSSEKEITKKIEFILDHYFMSLNPSLLGPWKMDLFLFKKWVNQFHLFNWIIIQMLSEISSQNYMEFFIYSLFYDLKKFQPIMEEEAISSYFKNLQLYLNIFIKTNKSVREEILKQIDQFILNWSARNFISSDIIYLNRIQLTGNEKSIYKSNYLKLFPLQKVKNNFMVTQNIQNLILDDLKDLKDDNLKEKDLYDLYYNDLKMKSKSIIKIDDMKSFLEYGKEFDQELCDSQDQIMGLNTNVLNKKNLEHLYKTTDRINYDFRIINEYFSIENDILIINFMINAIDHFGEFKSEHDLSKKTVYTLRHNLEFLSDRLIKDSIYRSLINRKENDYTLVKGNMDVKNLSNSSIFNVFKTNLFFLSGLFSRMFGTHLTYNSNFKVRKHEEKLKDRMKLGYYQFVKPLEKNYRAYVETLKTRNPLTILNDMTKVTFSGMHGKTDENTIIMEDRDIYPSYYGRLCLVKSPEGKFIGIVNYTSFHSRINNMGQIEVPYLKVLNGKLTGELVYLTSLEEKNHYITFSTEPYNKDGRLNGNIISCRYNNEFIVTDYLNISLHEAGTSFILSSVGALIPFPETNATARVLMGSNMQTQALQVSTPHTPLVKSGEEQLLSSVIHENNEVGNSNLNSFSSDDENNNCYFNDCNKNKENLNQEYTDFKDNDFLNLNKENNERSISYPKKIKEVCLGQNVLVGYVSVLGNTFEDSICISSRLLASGIFNHEINHLESSKDVFNLGKIKIILKLFKKRLNISESFENFYFWLSRGLSANCNVWSSSLVQVGQQVVKNQIISESLISFELTGEFFKEFNKYCFKQMEVFSADDQEKFKEEIFKVIRFIWNILDNKVKEHFFDNDFEYFKKFLTIFTTDQGISDFKSGGHIFPFPFPFIFSKPIQFDIIRYKGDKMGKITTISKKLLSDNSESSNKISLLLSKFRYHYNCFLDSPKTEKMDQINKLTKLYQDLFNSILENDNNFYRLISYIYLFCMSRNVYSNKLSVENILEQYSKDLVQIVLNFLDKFILHYLNISDGIPSHFYSDMNQMCNYRTYFKVQKLWTHKYGKNIESLFLDIIFRLFRDPFYPGEESSFFLHQLIRQFIFLKNEYGELFTNNHSLPKESILEFFPSCRNKEELDLYQIYLYIKSKKLEITDKRRKYINYGIEPKTKNDKFAKKIIILDEIFRSSFCFAVEAYSKIYEEALYKIEEDSYLDISILETHSVQEGDKLTGRFGNKGVVSKIIPFYEMPCLLDGTYLDIALNPLGVTSRMNLGQLLEVQLGYASFLMSIPLFNKSYNPDYSLEQYKAHNILQDKNMIYYFRNKSRSEFKFLLDSYETGMSQEVTSFKERDYDKELRNLCNLHELKSDFRLEVSASLGGNLLSSKINVGVMYMFKLEHTASKKVSARGVVGKTTWSSGQPASGKKHGGGQKYGEMEMSCFLGYGANRLLMELIGTKSGNNVTVHSLGRNLNRQKPLEHQQSSSTFDYLRSELENLGGTITSKSGISSRSLGEEDEEEFEKDDGEGDIITGNDN